MDPEKLEEICVLIDGKLTALQEDYKYLYFDKVTGRDRTAVEALKYMQALIANHQEAVEAIASFDLDSMHVEEATLALNILKNNMALAGDLLKQEEANIKQMVQSQSK